MAVTFEETFDTLADGTVITTVGHLDPAFRASANTFTDSTSATTAVAIPTGVVPGDLMVAFFVSSDTVAGCALVSEPAGWTVVRAHTSTGSMSSAFYFRIYVAGDAAPSWTLAGSRDVQAAVVAYSGVSSVDVTGYANRPGSQLTSTAPSATTLGPDRMVVRLYGEKSTTTTLITPPAGSQRVLSYGNGAASTSLLITDSEQENSGGTGTAVATYDVASANCVAATIALVPAPAVNPSTSWVSQRGTGPLPVVTNIASYSTPMSCRFNAGPGGRYMIDNLSAEHDRYFYRFYIYPLSTPSANDIVFGYEQDGAARASVRVNTDLTLSLVHNATAVASTTSQLVSNRWNRVEFNVDSVANTSRLELYAWPNESSYQPTQVLDRTDYLEAGNLEEVVTGYSGTATWSFLIDAMEGDDYYRPGPAPEPAMPPSVVTVPPSARWDLVSGPATGGYGDPIVAAYNREFTFRRNEPTVAGFDVKGRSFEADSLEELITDVHGLRDGVPIFRNRVGATQDTLDETDHTVKIGTLDYSAILQRRIFQNGDTVTFTAQDTGTMAWNVLSGTQGNLSGNLNIARGGAGVTSSIMTVTYELGSTIYDGIKNLAEQTSGFDWEIVPVDSNLLNFNIYPDKLDELGNPTGERRGSNKGVVLEYGGAVKSLTRDVDPSTYANAGRFKGGDDTLTAVDYVAAGTEPEGLWDVSEGYSDITNQNLLNARAAYRIQQYRLLQPTYTLVLKEGFWLGPSHIWLGDSVQVVVMSGRLAVNTTASVEMINVKLDDSGRETVTLTLGPLLLDAYKQLSQAFRRIRSLEVR